MSVRTASPPPRLSPRSSRRWWRGILSWVAFSIAPLGRFCYGGMVRRVEPERLNLGLVILLPGIDSQSFLCISAFQGLVDAEVPYALEIFDWTTGWNPLFLYHLRGRRRNQRSIDRLLHRIREYQSDYPGRPVWLLGHSGGGAIGLLAAEQLIDAEPLTGLIMLGPAISPRRDLKPALEQTRRGIWNFYSPLDFLFLGVGTICFGTIDGAHSSSAGFTGFRHQHLPPPPFPQLTEVRYRMKMWKAFHIGDHFGCVNRVFVAEYVAPIILADLAHQIPE